MENSTKKQMYEQIIWQEKLALTLQHSFSLNNTDIYKHIYYNRVV